MARHPYRRLRPAKSGFPEVGISEEGNIRSLHLGSDTVQSSMNLDRPSELVLSYSRAMMGWLLFAERLPQHITQIGLGGGSFARWTDTYLPDTRQTAVDINPQVIAIARNLFELPFEGGKFEIIEADGAEYIKVFRHNTDIILGTDSTANKSSIRWLKNRFSETAATHSLQTAYSLPTGGAATNAINASSNGC